MSVTVDPVFMFISHFSIILFPYTRVFIVAVSQAHAMQSHIRVAPDGAVPVTAKKSKKNSGCRHNGVF